MEQREFTRLCKSYGFSRVSPHYYARCIGDGILQTIYTGHKKYISPSSPNYSEHHRKSNYTIIGIYSLYSPWKESLFAPGIHSGLFYPTNFCPQPVKTKIFHGIEEEYEQMKDIVLLALDRVDTQEKLLELYCKVCTSKTGARIHDLSLVAPFFMCGRTEDAIFEICYQYMHSREGFRKTHSFLLQDGNIEEYIYKETERLNRLSVATDLWDAMLSQRYDCICKYLIGNYERNINWVNKYGISKMNSLFIRDLPKELQK